MYHELLRSVGQRSRSQCDITYQHEKCYNSGTDKLSKVKLGENYLRAKTCRVHFSTRINWFLVNFTKGGRPSYMEKWFLTVTAWTHLHSITCRGFVTQFSLGNRPSECNPIRSAKAIFVITCDLMSHFVFMGLGFGCRKILERCPRLVCGTWLISVQVILNPGLCPRLLFETWRLWEVLW